MAIAPCHRELRMAKPQDTVLTVDESAGYLKPSNSTLHHLGRRTDVPRQKIGWHRRSHKAVVDQWLGDTRTNG